LKGKRREENGRKLNEKVHYSTPNFTPTGAIMQQVTLAELKRLKITQILALCIAYIAAMERPCLPVIKVRITICDQAV